MWFENPNSKKVWCEWLFQLPLDDAAVSKFWRGPRFLKRERKGSKGTRSAHTDILITKKKSLANKSKKATHPPNRCCLFFEYFFFDFFFLCKSINGGCARVLLIFSFCVCSQRSTGSVCVRPKLKDIFRFVGI